MITLSKSGSTVTFTFDENSGYLQNGTIDVPVNSLSLVIDDSDMATFRKSASNDIFVSARYADFGMTKAELEAWYKANMVGSTGGGGGGVTPEEVQGMIDESISGKADSSSLATVATSGNYNDLTNKPTIPTVSSAITSGDTNAVQGGAVYDQVTIGGGMEVISSVTISSPYSSVVMPDCDKFTISAGTAVGDTLTSGGKVINVYDKSTDTFVFSSSSVSNMSSNYVIVEGTTADTSITLTAVDGYYFKGDNSMYFKSNYSGGWVVTFYKNADAEWLKNVVSANTIAIEGKQDTLIEGRAIDITNNTVSLDLPISAGTGTNSIAEGSGTIASGNQSHAEGYGTTASGNSSHAEGSGTIASGNYTHAECYNTTARGIYSHAEGNNTRASGHSSHAEGYYTKAIGSYSHAEGSHTEAKNDYEHASGKYNVSRTGATEADRTLFSVGNGTNTGESASNAFEIRQNGDIYVNDGTNDVRLQDTILGLGGFKLVQITQSAYDDLVTGGTVDNSTIYYIVN